MSDQYEYVTVSSNDSKNVYPDNAMSNFKVRLGWRMQRKGNWEVAGVRFSFTNSLTTFNTPQQILIHEKVKQGEEQKTSAIISIAPQRFQSVKHLIDTINGTVQNDVATGRDDRLPVLMQDSLGRVRKFAGMINKKVHVMELSEGLNLLLGLDRDGFYFMDAFRTELYVYADCVEPSIVGDITAPLLTTIDIGNNKMKPGEQTIVKISRPEYIPLSNSDITEIEVQILTDTGIAPQFEFGIISLTLHFRRR